MRRPRFQILLTGLIWAALAAWSHFHSQAPVRAGVLAGLAGTFILSSLLLPGLAGAIHRGLSAVARLVVSLVTWTLLGAVYFLVLTPAGLALRAAGSLRTARSLRGRAESYWADRPPETLSPGRYLRPF